MAKYDYDTLKTVARILVTDRRTERWSDGQTIAIAIPPPNFVCGGGNKTKKLKEKKNNLEVDIFQKKKINAISLFVIEL